MLEKRYMNNIHLKVGSSISDKSSSNFTIKIPMKKSETDTEMKNDTIKDDVIKDQAFNIFNSNTFFNHDFIFSEFSSHSSIS